MGKDNVKGGARGGHSIQLFESKFIDAITRTHIAVPVSIFFIYAIGLMSWSFAYLKLDGIVNFSLFFAGLIGFTWVEYQIHRHLFHLRPTSEKKKKLQYIIHGVHHDDPRDKKRLAMPPVLSLLIATFLLLLAEAVLGDFSFPVLAGFLSGYAGYLLVHYLVHVYPPPKNAFRILWIHHGIHHYKTNVKAFGVSSPLWDYVYKTMP